MVALLSEVEKLNEVNNEYKARVTILSQQQLRLTRDVKQLKTDIKVANVANVDIQRDMTKLNSLISENHEEEGKLQSANFLLETECVEELKEMEKDCVSTESAIVEAKTSKSTLLDEILEMERQSLLWEKKIQLDKETRDALDPSVGQAESQNMEHEIHRMELRLTAREFARYYFVLYVNCLPSVQREQERLSTEIERSIQKRSTIATRFKGKATASNAAGSKSAGDLTQANVKRRIGALKREVIVHYKSCVTPLITIFYQARMLAEDTAQINVRIEEQKAHLHEMTSELERTTIQYNTTEELTRQLQGEINDLLYQKQVHQERISYRTKYFKRLKETASVGVDMTQSLQIERRLLSANQALENVKTIIGDLTDAHPHLGEVLQRVGAMTEPGLDAIFTESQ
jgi:hypothetical protein